MTIILGVPKDNLHYEKRVSIAPETVPRLKGIGVEVLVEADAGEMSYFPDRRYVDQGGRIVAKREELFKKADIITSVQRPSESDVSMMKPGSILIGILLPDRNPELIEAAVKSKVTTFALERLPRTTRAQSMDVLSSQSSVAGYQAAILAAINSPRLMPMLTTAAGTIKPSRVLVIGAGVAGLMAIATSKRLGGKVTAYDVRRAAGDDVRSLGAKFLELDIDASSASGYARELTEVEKESQQKMLENALQNSDIVITTAAVPGKKAPLIIRKELVERMEPGTVIVDLAADSGGNCELTRIGEIVDFQGKKIVGAANLPAEVPINASEMYSRNIFSFLQLIVRNGALDLPFDDDILKACMVSEGMNGKEVN